MQQRIIRPALFALLLLCTAFLAAYSDRGASILSSPYHLSSLADYAGSMPFISACMTVLASLAAMLFFLVPDADTIVLLVSSLGFYSGTFIASFELCLAGGIACLVTRYFLHDSMRLWMVVRRRSHLPALRNAQLPLEYCLLITALLLCCTVPAVAAGFVLGILGMRPKAFCIGAYPFLAAKAVMTGYSVVPASWYALLFTGILGTAIAILYLVWLLALVRKVRLSEKAREKAAALAPSVIREQKVMAIDIDEPVHVPASENRETVSLSDALVLLVTDNGSDKSSEAILKAVRSLGVRVQACSLAKNASSSAADTAPDLDALLVRAFRNGYGKVLCARPVSALLRADIIQEALQALGTGCGLVLGQCAGSYYMIGVAQKCGRSVYEDGLLQGMDFSSDIAFALAGFARHPKMLPELPPNDVLFPLCSVIVLAENARPTVAGTVRAALSVPCAECLVVTSESAAPVMREAETLGATVLPVKESLVASLNEAADLAHGRYLVFLYEGVELPQDFDKAVWDTMRGEKCMAGAFGTSRAVPRVRRTARWLGSAVQPGRLAGPDLTQGVFLRKDDFLRFGGFEGTKPEEAVAGLAQKASHAGTIVIHNARVRFLHAMPGFEECGAEAGAESGAAARTSGLGWLAQQARKRITSFFARQDDARAREERKKAIAMLQRQAQDMTSGCDHCGRCTHASPMLHSHNIDLSELVQHPLLSWHCFMCGSCIPACHKGIDGPALARLLRRIHVLSHADRLARPGHAVTLAHAKFCPLYTKCAQQGTNVLLPAQFCSAWPKTAMALGRLCRQKGLGLIVADTGAELADLGLHAKACSMAEKLKEAMNRLGVTELATVSPHDQRWLAANGISCVPLQGLSDTLGLGTISMDSRCLFIPCADRAGKHFLRALAPLLRGTVREIDVPCCGAGGEASVLEPVCAAKMKSAVQSAAQTDRVLTYCPRCAGTLKASGIATDLDLSVLLNVAEQPVSGLRRISSFVSCLKGLSGLLALAEEKPEAMPEPASEDQQAQDSAAEETVVQEEFLDTAGQEGDGSASLQEHEAGLEAAAEAPESSIEPESAENGQNALQKADDAWFGLDDGAAWDGEDDKASSHDEEKTAAEENSSLKLDPAVAADDPGDELLNMPGDDVSEPDDDSDVMPGEEESGEESGEEKAPAADGKQEAARKAVSLDAYRE